MKFQVKPLGAAEDVHEQNHAIFFFWLLIFPQLSRSSKVRVISSQGNANKEKHPR